MRVALVAVLLAGAHLSHPRGGQLEGAPSAEPVARQVYVMGTPATLTTLDGDRRHGIARLERLLAAIERTEQQLSTWRDSSEVSRINAAAGTGPVRLSDALCRTTGELARWVEKTGGAFDPAIGSVIQAWDVHGKGRVPAPTELREARQHAGWSRVRFDSDGCTIALPRGTSLDVGAWGKGEGLDRARDAVAGENAPWMIDIGGQIAAHGSAGGGDGWPVAVAHPLDRGTPLFELRLEEGSLATSAGSERDLYVSGRRVAHILDPRTAQPASFTGSVTVWHEDALVADILSTALFVMGPEAGLRWAEARGVAACYLVPRDGGAVARRPTKAFARRFAIS